MNSDARYSDKRYSDTRYSDTRYSNPRQKRTKQAAKGGGFLFYAIPFVIVNAIIFFAATSKPEVKVELIDEHNFKNVKANITVNRFYPLSGLDISFDNDPVTLNKETSGMNTIYTAEFTKNGTLSVVANGFNGMNDVVYENIGSIDEAPPIIDGVIEEIEDEAQVLITFEDSQSGINFSSIYASSENGLRIPAISIDESRMEAVFTLELNESLDVYVSDNVGNQAIAHFTRNEDTVRW